jgi:hypothetical protein
MSFSRTAYPAPWVSVWSLPSDFTSDPEPVAGRAETDIATISGAEYPDYEEQRRQQENNQSNLFHFFTQGVLKVSQR